MSPTPFLAGLALSAAVLVASLAEAQNDPGTESPGFHGMLVLGAQKIYVSHLPMFTALHRYQGIWEVSFGADGDQRYRRERALPANANQIFTLAPKEDFRLPDLTTTRQSFKADVFVGHFERKGRLLLEDVTVTLRNLVHFHPFKHSQHRPEALTYVLFGSDTEVFLVHWITVAPNYDQVLVAGRDSSIGEIPAGAVFTMPGRSDSDALRAGESVSGVLIAGQGPEEPFLVKPVKLNASSEFYLEKGELARDQLPARP